MTRGSGEAAMTPRRSGEATTAPRRSGATTTAPRRRAAVVLGVALLAAWPAAMPASPAASGSATPPWSAPSAPAGPPAPPQVRTVPRQAVVYRTGAPLVIDGKLEEPAWGATEWSAPFVDIEGDRRPAPRFATRVKMLWDAERFYVAAQLEEPDVWATIRARDAVIYQDPDFEVFIDPDGDTHEYYELEVNALGTPWDLFLVRPYRDGGPALNGWDIAGLQVGIDIRGTINQPGDRDESWTVELALPWTSLRDASPNHRPPAPGDHWRVNFSRVEWQVTATGTTYVKRRDPATTRVLPEDNWVWSPQGAIDMHRPEHWGIVQFSNIEAGEGTEAFREDPNDRVKAALRELYERQRAYRETHGRYAPTLEAIAAYDLRVSGTVFRPVMQATDDLYEIAAPGFGGATVHIRQDGRVW
ncbi:MAG: carbohydrate-binding family 9-like protein [Vicinamibacterales bacterium]